MNQTHRVTHYTTRDRELLISWLLHVHSHLLFQKQRERAKQVAVFISHITAANAAHDQ